MDLLAALEELGIQRLHEGRKEISGRCPAHKRITGHEDSHPSWSISKETGAHICYSCGWRGGLADLFVEVRGSVPDDLVQDLQVASLNRAIDRSNADEVEEIEPDWSWENEMSVAYPVPQGLADHRHLKAEALKHYDVWWNKERRSWMLPFTRPDGTVYGAQYRAKGIELNLPVGVETKESLFGIDKVLDQTGPVTLVESPLDAVRLWQVGVAAVAAYGAWVSEAQVSMLSRHFNLVVIAMDADKAGMDSTTRLRRAFGRKRLPCITFDYPTIDPASPEFVKDPGEFTTDEELYLRWNRSFSLFPDFARINEPLLNGRSNDGASSLP